MTSELYDAYYYATGCGPYEYERNDNWLSFYKLVANQIITKINPVSVLDAGCSMGLLVESLRNEDVEAYGIDISEYAISQVHKSIKPYCQVGSIIEPFLQKYDLITCVEVLEHLKPFEGEQAVANLCNFSDDILFSSTPFDYKEATHFNVQPVEYWVELFARHGFFRDVDFDASFLTPWAIRFRRSQDPASRIILAYERRMWQLLQENLARRDLTLEQRNELSTQEITLTQLTEEKKVLLKEVEKWQNLWEDLEKTPGWALLSTLQRTRALLFPPKSIRDQCLDDVLLAIKTRKISPLFDAANRINKDITRIAKVYSWKAQLRFTSTYYQSRKIEIKGITPRPPIQTHTASVDIVICIHNALDDVKRCLDSVIRTFNQPFQLILVDDGSDNETAQYLDKFANEHEVTVIRNEQARGYTLAANQGLQQSNADYVILLNSDTIVTNRWIDCLIDCAESDKKIGMVGPLSNTASWQSIPEIEIDGDWATNPLPEGMTIDEMGDLVARYSDRLYPDIPFLNGFCLLIRSQTLKEVGFFDEQNFGAGYGEENDYAIRVRQAGWRLAVADNAYVYHAQSRSYSHERRKHLSEAANLNLAKKHGQAIFSDGVEVCRNSRVLNGIRVRSRVMFERQSFINKGIQKFGEKRILFVLPLGIVSGGGNVIIDEALVMREMGIDVHIFNLNMYKEDFRQAYPKLPFTVHFGEKEDIAELAHEFDAVIATSYFSVEWLASIECKDGMPIRGYYIQDFEPYLYTSENETAYRDAWNSYTLIPDMICFTKTAWNAQEVKTQTGVDCEVIGSSLNLDLFQPRPRSQPEDARRPLTIVAMVRAKTHYRGPQLTMEILQKASKTYGKAVRVIIFGTELEDVDFADLPLKFDWQLAGILHRNQVAQLLNEADIFVDFSTHQAMGLTALEAMACGAATIVPIQGGATTFAHHEKNSLVIDTSSADECWQSLRRLIDNQEFRLSLQTQARADISQFFLEKPAFNILNLLFKSIAQKIQ